MGKRFRLVSRANFNALPGGIAEGEGPQSSLHSPLPSPLPPLRAVPGPRAGASLFAFHAGERLGGSTSRPSGLSDL